MLYQRLTLVAMTDMPESQQAICKGRAMSIRRRQPAPTTTHLDTVSTSLTNSQHLLCLFAS